MLSNHILPTTILYSFHVTIRDYTSFAMHDDVATMTHVLDESTMPYVLEADHKVKTSHSFLDDDGVGITKPKKAFRSTQNTFIKLPQNFYLTEFLLTDWLTD